MISTKRYLLLVRDRAIIERALAPSRAMADAISAMRSPLGIAGIADISKAMQRPANLSAVSQMMAAMARERQLFADFAPPASVMKDITQQLAQMRTLGDSVTASIYETSGLDTTLIMGRNWTLRNHGRNLLPNSDGWDSPSTLPMLGIFNSFNRNSSRRPRDF